MSGEYFAAVRAAFAAAERGDTDAAELWQRRADRIDEQETGYFGVTTSGTSVQ